MLILLLRAIYWLLNLVSFLILARSLVSWLPNRGGKTLNAFLVTMTDPVLAPVRKLMSKFKFARELPVDFSPVVAIILLYLIDIVISTLIYL